MKKQILLSLFFLAAYAAAMHSQEKANTMETFIKNLMDKMTVKEKIGQLNLTVSGGFVAGETLEKDLIHWNSELRMEKSEVCLGLKMQPS